jgi:hypothetical protein
LVNNALLGIMFTHLRQEALKIRSNHLRTAFWIDWVEAHDRPLPRRAQVESKQLTAAISTEHKNPGFGVFATAPIIEGGLRGV